MSGRWSAPPYGQIGPALPQALRLARCQAAGLIRRPVHELPDEADIMEQEISREEERLLVSNAQVVAALEDLFSWRNKDRLSRTSKLSYAESWRFQRALYRMWLLSYLYGMPPPGSARESEEYQGEELERSIPKQKDFLMKFSSRELLQIRYITFFLRTVAGCVSGEFAGSLDVYDFEGLYQFAGPHAILRCYEEGAADPLRVWKFIGDYGPYEGFLTKPLMSILEERKFDVHQNGTPFYKALLDQRNGEDDKCTRCKSVNDAIGMRSGVNLWNETNWDYLRCYYTNLSESVTLSLGKNRTETKLHKALALACKDISRFMHQMFNNKREPYTQWRKADWVCLECLGMFISETIPFWWLDRKQLEG
ncbi:hypothetical protein BOTBODRAFT_111608 [Botryobasidium botryosum FD-172 SS1]|uniref:Uncharacterized protein n=1 Tax=Botryobasidium botryosum (strain FD-172 SS1) TaxID=930990 RepID=A0A067MCE0_BOTB1|nr:hypothetical protein BOTBODRAFT_111608 [Botryobasidium botryosum FD-172 SS1]